jgi:hypothetical protein
MYRKGPRARAIRAAFVFSFLSTLISSIALLYTVRIFAAAYRPYVGVAEVQIHADSRAGLRWTFVFKNFGTVPATVHWERHEPKLIRADGRRVDPRSIGASNAPTVLMPTQISDLSGQVHDQVISEEVLAGRASLEVEIAISYRATGEWSLWPSAYRYQTTQRFQARGRTGGPAFLAVSYEAD